MERTDTNVGGLEACSIVYSMQPGIQVFVILGLKKILTTSGSDEPEYVWMSSIR